MLGEVRGAHPVAHRHPAAGGRALADERLQQRRLAGAVRRHDRQALPALQREPGPADQPPAGDLHVEAVHLDHDAAAALRLGEPERQVRLAAGRLDPDDPVELLLARRGLPGLRARPPARDEPLQAGDLLRLLLRLGALAVDREGPLTPERRVAHRPVLRPATVELQHAGRHRLQEPAVVGDEDHGGVDLHDRALQPLDRLDVEVVRGLVQQQHVGPRHQRARQRRARELAAREAHERPRELLLADAETAQHALHPGAPGVAAGPLESRLRLLVRPHHLVAVVAGGHAGLQGGQVGLGPAGRLHALADVLLQRQVPAERRPLVVEGHGRAARHADRAAVRVEPAGEDPEQRRLALAVAPDDGQALAGLNAEGDVGQHVTCPEGLADLNRLHGRLG